MESRLVISQLLLHMQCIVWQTVRIIVISNGSNVKCDVGS
jgi:hypothetical protein